MIPLEMALNFAWKHWRIIAGGLALAVFSILLLTARASSRHWHKEADQERQLFETERTSHAVTKASLVVLENAIEAKNAESEARAKAYNATQLADAAERASLNARLAADSARLATLAGYAHGVPNGACPVPAGLADALKGL